jgi:hypothetical protein
MILRGSRNVPPLKQQASADFVNWINDIEVTPRPEYRQQYGRGK